MNKEKDRNQRRKANTKKKEREIKTLYWCENSANMKVVRVQLFES